MADIQSQHTANMHGSGVGLNMVTATFGPRYSYKLAHSRSSIFAQVLTGEATGFNSTFPAQTGARETAYGLAVQMGGGLNVELTPRIAVRAFEADWMRTQLPNATTNVQNNLRMGAGFVLRF